MQTDASGINFSIEHPLKSAIVSVINDLSTDQRVHKMCCTLRKLGYNVTLVGRKLHNSLPLEQRIYSIKRMNLLFEKGPLFYMEFQMRLFFLLLLKKSDILLSNDLDTLLPNYLISEIKGSILIYDTHELFCEVPELMNRPFKKRIWKTLEKIIFPKLKYVFTVNESIARIYSNEYNVAVHVMRNFPFSSNKQNQLHLTKADLGIDNNKKIILIQSAGINMDRGVEEAVQAMQYIENTVLLIVGTGDVIEALKEMTKKMKLNGKVYFAGKVPFEKLKPYTQLADIGLCLIKPTNLNYQYSLPNKICDYIHAGVPVLTTELIEIKKIINSYNVGTFIENHSPEHIAEKLNTILADQTTLLKWKQNTQQAAQELNWETEELKIISVFTQISK